jgi:peptide/nickel transport system permease protein
MRRMILRRVATSVITVVGCSLLVFALRYLLPGGPIQDMIGGSGQTGGGGGGTVPISEVKALEARFGLNNPPWVQYWDWVTSIFHGDFGRSYYSDEPVRTVLMQRAGPSLELIIGALLLAVILGGALGIYSAIRRERPGGRAVLAATGLGISIPDFWLATLAAGFLGLKLHIFPPLWPAGPNPSAAASLHYLILPILLLSIVAGAFICRQLHSSMAEALRSPYIRTAWAMGVPPRTIYLNYALRNAIGPVITLIPLAFAALVSGTVLVEYIFNIPGLGSQIVTSVINLDYPVVQATVLILAIVVAILNLLSDIALGLLDPRIRRGV